jgi:hypothetical protein
MDYKDVRKKFVTLSGRYDLVNPDWSDNGADFFMNAGQRFLDRLQSTGKMQAKHIQSVAAGTIKVYSTGLRVVNAVWVGTSTDGLIQLSKETLSGLREYYGEQLSSSDRGTPIYYAPAIFRPFTDALTSTTLASYYDADDLIFPTAPATTPTHFANTGVIIMPPPDKIYYVSIYGLFYSPDLSATVAAGVWTQTKSFWSEVYPETLIKAALMQVEMFYRNSEGVKDWESGVMKDISGFDKDAAEEEAVDISEMGG